MAKVAPPSEAELAKLGPSTILVGFLNPLGNPAGLEAIAATGATALAMERIPRISRAQSMDALSSQATVSGYRAVLIASTELERFFPMFMTAAGTVPPAQVLVLGARCGRAAGDRHRAPARRGGHRVRHPQRRRRSRSSRSARASSRSRASATPRARAATRVS